MSVCLACARPQAEAFALLSEEGIAKGVRRIVAVTRGEAARAIAEGDRLAAELRAIGALPDEQLEKASKAFKEVGEGGGGVESALPRNCIVSVGAGPKHVFVGGARIVHFTIGSFQGVALLRSAIAGTGSS